MPKGTSSKSLFSKEYDQFLEELRKARIAAGLTQAEVAKRLNRPQSFVSKCESGERRVDVVEANAFCKIYGIRLTKMLSD